MRIEDDLAYVFIHISHASAGWQSVAKFVVLKKGFVGVRNRLTLVEMFKNARIGDQVDVASARSFEKFITCMFLLEPFAKGLDRLVCAVADSEKCAICNAVSEIL